MPADSVRWYTVEETDNIDSPALLIYLHRVKHNLALALEMVGDPGRLRPHAKTHKSPQVTELMLQAGITKFKCATIAEAEMLARCGAPDVLLAYPPAGPKIGRLITLMQAYPATRFSCLVDAAEVAQAIAEAAVHRSVEVDVFLDVDLGMSRTGIAPEKAGELYRACAERKGLRAVGLHGYDGHITDLDPAVRKQRADEAYSRLAAVQQELVEAGLPQPLMVIGGSPTFPLHASRSGVECSPGTFAYWDWSYSGAFPDMGFLPAVLVLSRVVSVNGRRLCLDLGHKSIAAENELSRRVHWLNADGLVPVSHSEEHLVVEGPADQRYRVGDVLYGMPYHVCPTCALYDRAFVIEDRRVKEEWKMTARDRKLSV